MNAQEKKLMDTVWQFPLFKALSQRRVHRVGLGINIEESPFPWKSEKKPVPLSELETAILCWAGNGINGLILADIDYTLNNYLCWVGRTHGHACNDQHAHLVFINDNGVFLYRPLEATKIVEIETEEDREKLLTWFRKDTVKLDNARPDFTSAGVLKLNSWSANKPGSTLFMPIIDMTYEYLNFLSIAFSDERNQIIDSKTGKPAGVKKWIDNGFLNGPTVPVSLVELYTYNTVVAAAHYMAQNISLACAAMGLGNIVWAGLAPLVVMGGTPLTKGLGFRFITGKDGMPNPVGKDGYMESLCPPYFKNMDEAVDKFLDVKMGKGGLFSADYPGKVPWQDKSMPTKAVMYSKETIGCIRDYCNYIYDTYGRFPATVDTMHIPIASTCHHLDLDFYDKYYVPGTIRKEQREHMKVWHEE